MFFHSFIYRKKSFLLLFFISVSSFSQQIGDGVATYINDFSLPLKSGLYQGSNPIGATPDLSHPWQHLFVLRHSEATNNHQLQIGSSYNTNDRLFFRKIAAGLQSSNPEWIEVATRGTNVFSGNQTVNGNINLAGVAGRRIFMGGIGGTTFGLAYDSTYPNYGIFYTEGEPDFVSISPNGNATNGVMNILGNGNVGIGTTSPNSKLVIAGGDYGISIHTNAAASGLGFNRNVMDGAIYNSSVAAWQFTARNEMFTLEGYNGAAHQLFSVMKEGNIGIGTFYPKYKLDVIGTIRSREVKVDMNGADFVFEEKYPLMPLSELETYIKKNKHLPEIAPAKEMQEQGSNLGDLNTKLLQKIEELTLYTIEQNKKLQLQNEKIIRLEQKMEQLVTQQKQN